MYALDLEWIFDEECWKGKTAFIDYLALTENDEIFAISNLSTMITYIWGKYYNQILWRVFIPYLSYFTLFIFYVTLLFEKREMNSTDNRWAIITYIC
jgi:hypothetical protein